MDAYLFQRAKNLEKHLFGLEKIEDQFKLLQQNNSQDTTSFSKTEIDVLDSLSEAELPDIRELISKREETIDLLTNIYQKGDISQVDEFINLFYGENSKKKWLLDRNEDMLKSMKSLMTQYSLFTAVGCAHLPGDGGLIDLLVKDGFNVRRVIPNNTGVAKEKMNQKLVDKWKLFVNDQSGLHVEVPSTPHDIDILAGFKLHMVTDLIKNESFVFYGIPCALAGIDPSDPKRFKIIIDRMKDEGKIKDVTSQKRISHDGQKGYQMKVTIEQKSYEYQGVVRLFTVNSFLYAFMAMTDSDEISNRFFKSVRFLEPMTKGTNATGFRLEPEAGFSAIMPGRHEKNELVLPQDPAMPEFKIKMSQFIATDISTNIITAIFKTSLAPGQCFDNDSTTINLMLSDFDPNIKYGDMYGEKLILESGVSGFQPDLIVKDGSMSILVRCFIRGPSVYLVFYQAPQSNFSKNSANKFFNSIEFLPLLHDKLSEKKINEVNVMLANDLISSNLDVYYDHIEFMSNDFFPKSIISVSIYKEPISKYLEIEPIDTIYHNYSNDYLTWQEEIIKDTVVTNSKGDQYMDLLISTPNTTTLERRIVYFKNEAYYTFSYYISPEMKTSIWLDELIKKTTIDDIKPTLNSEERHQSFFTDLLSKDKELFDEVNKVIYEKKITEEDVDQINLVLS